MEYADYLASGEMPEGFLEEDPRMTQMEEQHIVSPSQLPASDGTTKVARRSKNFTIGEDEKLVSAWLDISIDPVVGNQQRAGSFWVRIHEHFMLATDPEQPRTRKALEHRWGHIQEHVCKFCGCYDKILALRASGKTEQDKIADAIALFTGMHKKTFNLLHCWRLLRGHPKWMTCLASLKTKAPGTAEPSESVPGTDTPMTNSSINLEENTPSPDSDYMRRPGGKKAAKKRSRDEAGGSYNALVDELRTSRRERAEKMSQMEEHSLSVEMEMVAIKKEKVRVQENELQLRREQLEFEQQMRREQLQLDQQIRRDQVELEKQKAERENRKVLLEATREEERIMNIDLAALGERARAYYVQRQEEILQKRMEK